MRSVLVSTILATLALAACSSSQPAKNVAMATPFVMDQAEHIAMQRPSLPNTESIAWKPHDRLYRSVVVDYVQGMSQRSYLFSKPDQQTFRPMLAEMLDRAGLLARSRAEARYALQVHFTDIKAQAIGVDFAGRSRAVYRVVDRSSGRVVFESPVEAQFLALYPELHEGDFATAYNIAKPGVVGAARAYSGYVIGEGILTELINNNSGLTDFFDGPITEASQATWDDVTQAYVWTTGVSLLLGPLEVIRRQLDPTNYIAFASNDGRAKSAAAGARQGVMSGEGFGSRHGRERARQANTYMLGQSITKFTMDLAVEEGVRFTAILPCTPNREVEELKTQLMLQGIGFRTEACDSTRFSKPRSPHLPNNIEGLDFTRWN